MYSAGRHPQDRSTKPVTKSSSKTSSYEFEEMYELLHERRRGLVNPVMVILSHALGSVQGQL
jgi:hypothetical protein